MSGLVAVKRLKLDCHKLRLPAFSLQRLRQQLHLDMLGAKNAWLPQAIIPGGYHLAAGGLGEGVSLLVFSSR